MLENLPKTKYDLASSSIPGITWSELQQSTGIELPQTFDLGRNDSQGANELKKVLASIYKCDLDRIVTTTGGSEANFLVNTTMLDKSDELILEQPSYCPLWAVPQTIGAKVIPWQRRYGDNFGLDIESMENLITKRTKMISITNLHNPSGVAADPKAIRAASEIATDHHLHLLIDEIYVESAFRSQKSSANLGSVIVTSSATKVFGLGGMRTGWIIAPPEIAKRCQKMKTLTTGSSPYFSEVLTASTLSNARNQLADRCRNLAQTNFKIVKDWIKKQGDYLEWIPPDGGFISFPRYKMKLDSERLCKRLLDRNRVLVSPGEFFGLEGHIRLTYRNKTRELPLALEALSEGLRALSG